MSLFQPRVRSTLNAMIYVLSEYDRLVSELRELFGNFDDLHVVGLSHSHHQCCDLLLGDAQQRQKIFCTVDLRWP
jgi:hypothetical protein